MNDVRLPKHMPVYKQLLHGEELKKIIAWLKKIQGNLGDIDLGNPELQTILLSIISRVSTLETTVTGLAGLVDRVSNVETTLAQQGTDIGELESGLTDLETDLANLTARVVALEGQPGGSVDLTEINEAITELENAVAAVQSAIEAIKPITNSRISEILDEVENG